MNIKTFVISSFASCLLLVGCGGTGQDDPSGTGGIDVRVLSGQAVDGYVARGLVFIDTNENDQLDSWEPRAFTDNEGYFSVNQRTGENYCAEGVSASKAEFCLEDNLGLETGVIQITGGYDLLTELPFDGRLSARVAMSDINSSGVLVTPLTSLVAGFEDSSDRAAVLTKMGLTEGDLTVNYLDTDLETSGQEVNGDLLNKAIKLHKVTSVLASLIEDTYTDLGEESNLPSDASAAVYESFSEALLDTTNTLDQFLGSSSQLEEVIESAETKIRQRYEDDEDLTPPSALTGTSGSGEGVENTAGLASSLSDFVDSVLTDDADLDDATGGARAVEVITQKIFEEIERATDQNVEEAISVFEGADGSELIDLISGDDADLSGLIESVIDDSQDVRDNGTISGDALGNIGGRKLRVQDPDQDKTARVEFYFHGESAATEGSLTACIRYQEIDEFDQPKDDASNTEGKILEGSWSFLNENRYAVIVMLELLDTPYQAILRASDNGQFRFDYDGEFESWNGLNGGIVDQDSNDATTDQGCVELMANSFN